MILKNKPFGPHHAILDSEGIKITEVILSGESYTFITSLCYKGINICYSEFLWTLKYLDVSYTCQ
jgi:hypothetical protein